MCTFCALYRKERGHGHCASLKLVCSETSVYKETSLCRSHCVHKNHNHCCTSWKCDTEACDNGDSMCPKHRDLKNHSHCSEKNCLVKPTCKSAQKSAQKSDESTHKLTSKCKYLIACRKITAIVLENYAAI